MTNLTTTTTDEFGATDVRFCAAILGYSWTLDDYGTDVLVAPSATRQAPTRKSTRSSAPAAKIDPTAIVTVLVANPKKPGSATHARFALYVSGATVADCLKAGVLAGDVRWDLDHGFIRVDAVN